MSGKHVEDTERTRMAVDGVEARARAAGGWADSGPLLAEIRSLLDELQIQRELLLSERRELAAERERFRQMYELAPDAYLVTDGQGVILEANRTASTLLGEGHEALLGRPVAEFVVETQRPFLASRLLRLARSHEPDEWQMALRGPEGAPRTVVAATVGTVTQGDRVDGFRWLLRDASHEKRAEQARQRLLQEQAARAHAEVAQRRDSFLAEASGILAGSLDYETTLASVSRLAVPRIADSCIAYVVGEEGSVHRVGVAHADPEKEAWLRGLLENRAFDPHALTGPIARALRTGEEEILPEVPAWELESLSDGLDEAELAADVAPRSLMVVPLRIRDRILGALSFGWAECGRYTPEDLWLARKLADRAALAIENARLHREARRASDAKSEFLASMSHEFRTPLTAIMAFAELLVEGIPEPISGAPKKHAEQILLASKHLADLVDQVLTLSRIEAGRDRVQVDAVDLAELARETVALVEPLARQKALRLRVERPRGGLVVETDPNKVRQVLFNLLGNAVKFTERGEIRLVLRPEPEGATLEVHDTGEGIPPEQLERIWEPFWRATHPGGTRPAGTGLGLGIVRRLVSLLGGEVRARSEPGRGSVFTVELKNARRQP